MSTAATSRPSGSGTALAWIGALVALTGMVSYFLVAVWWPVLRDSALPNVVLSFFGLALALAGLVRGLRRPRGRLLRLGASGLAVLSAGFLAFYVYSLSYQLPSTSGVLAEGVKAPSFALEDAVGKTRRLEEFDERKLLLVFFRGHW